jgi:hypothetical protein
MDVNVNELSGKYVTLSFRDDGKMLTTASESTFICSHIRV